MRRLLSASVRRLRVRFPALCPHLNVQAKGSLDFPDHVRLWGICLTCGKQDVSWMEVKDGERA